MTPACAIARRSGGRDQDRAAQVGVGPRQVFVLADGAGGVGAGALAAEAVVAQARSFALGCHPSALDALRCADLELGTLGGLSTGVIVEIVEGVIRGASCGDSIAWLIADGEVAELTHAQQRKPLLGDGGAPVAFGPVPLRGRLLLASDGLVDYVRRDLIAATAMASDLAASAAAVAGLPRLRDGSVPDDVAVILVEAVA